METKKLSILYILAVLKEYSDINHPLTQKDILSYVKNIYGLELERKCVSYSIQLLIDFGYDINYSNRKGYYLLTREFDNSEINYLVDAIFSSKSIPVKEAQSLIKKTMSFLSKYERKDFSQITKVTTKNRTNNNEVMLNIEILNEAIKTKKKVSFTYLGYDENGNLVSRNTKYQYIVNPYYLFNSMGKYYLLCNYDYYDTLSSYRVDYIKDLKLLDEDAKDEKEVEQLKEFDISSFLNDHLYLFNCEVITAKVKCIGTDKDKKRIIFAIKDWFNKNASIVKENNEIHAIIKCDKNSLKYWILQYGTYLEVIEPLSLKEEIINSLNEMLKIYSKN